MLGSLNARPSPFLPHTVRGPLGLREVQGALPLGRRALYLALSASPLATLWPATLLRPLGLTKAQGALPLGHCALSPPLSASTLAALWPATVPRPLGLTEAQSALPLGRRSLSLPLSASPLATLWPPTLPGHSLAYNLATPPGSDIGPRLATLGLLCPVPFPCQPNRWLGARAWLACSLGENNHKGWREGLAGGHGRVWGWGLGKEPTLGCDPLKKKGIWRPRGVGTKGAKNIARVGGFGTRTRVGRKWPG